MGGPKHENGRQYENDGYRHISPKLIHSAKLGDVPQVYIIGLDKSGYQVNIFLNFQ